MFRSILALTAFVVFGSLTAAADGTQYRDTEGRFTLTVPTGWSAQRPKSEQIAVVLMSPIQEESKGGICLVMVRDIPQTRKMSQAELDEAFTPILTEEFWKKAFEAAGGSNVNVDEAGQKDQRGRKVYYVVATVGATDPEGKAVKATGKQMLHIVPGSMQFVNCTTVQDMYSAMSPQFEAIFASFEPKVNEYLVQAPEAATPSVLTLFEGPRFNGPARVVAQDTPNVPALAGIAASVAIAGFGRWEICDGVNYAGNCQVVTSAEGSSAMRIGSVRRHAEPNDVLGAAGIISAVTGVEFRDAADRVVRAR
jgi:PsbP